jgi:hypothetical protein
MQMIEGFNVSDLGFGSASAKAVTLSYWVKSSLTGLMGGSLRNDSANRSYPFSYTISVANTWEYKTITIAGDTSGTWLTTNGIGIRLVFSLGCGPSRLGTAGAWNANNNTGPTGEVPVIGTLNATWNITGVQLEKGSTATSFDYRPYGTELALCQRYTQRYPASTSSFGPLVNGYCSSTTRLQGVFIYPVPMRAAPTYVLSGSFRVLSGASAIAITSSDSSDSDEKGSFLRFDVTAGLVVGNGGAVTTSSSSTAYTLFTAEL